MPLTVIVPSHAFGELGFKVGHEIGKGVPNEVFPMLPILAIFKRLRYSSRYGAIQPMFWRLAVLMPIPASRFSHPVGIDGKPILSIFEIPLVEIWLGKTPPPAPLNALLFMGNIIIMEVLRMLASVFATTGFTTTCETVRRCLTTVEMLCGGRIFIATFCTGFHAIYQAKLLCEDRSRDCDFSPVRGG